MPELRPYVDPIPNVPLSEFPQSTAPEGCRVLDAPADDEAFQVEYHEFTYVVRTLEDGKPCPRVLYALVPSAKDPIRAVYDENSHPCVVFVQGSAWHKQNVFGHFSDHVRLCERGFVVASIQYRESDLAPFPAQMQDAKTAIRFLRANASNLHIDPARMALWGDSSGAHTALMAAFTATGPTAIEAEGQTILLDTSEFSEQSAAVSCVVDWFGPTVLDQMNCVPSTQDHTGPLSPEGCVLGGVNVSEHPGLVRAASPLTYIPKASEHALPPTLIMHGGRDQLVNFEQSVLLYDALRAAGQEVTFYQLPDAHHGSNGFRTKEALGVVERFLRKHL